MKIADEAMWTQQVAELEADDTGRAFLAFIHTWVDQAETLCAENIGGPATALNHALAHAEATHGRISAHYLGQMLVVIGTHWEHGQGVIEGLRPIELRLVQDVLALKVAELEAQAVETVGDR